MHQLGIPQAVEDLRRACVAARPRPLEWRRRQLQGIVKMLREREAEFLAAMHADLGKPGFEAFCSDIAFVLSEVRFALRHLRRWMRPKSVRTPLVLQPGSSRVMPEPLGVVLIIGAWNYPVQLVLLPLLGALAAGNAAVVKPSEVAPHTSSALARSLPEYLDRDCLRVIEGGAEVTSQLLEQRFDAIFYTGNGEVAKLVLQAAARHLTPVTLELGGKSPCIVDRDANLDVAARRIVWGKFFNAGQTCVAPDYLLVHESVEGALLERLTAQVRTAYGAEPHLSPDFGRIVNRRHLDRLRALLPGSHAIHCGGDCREAENYLAPTILRDVSPDAAVMQGEIFGPILPVLRVRDHRAAVEFVNARPRPLALYLFSRSGEVQREVTETAGAGGICINHVLLHAANPHLPFGGVGASGMGAYHGERSFLTFSHLKPVLYKPAWFDPSAQYPPYSEGKLNLVRRFGCGW